MKSRGIHTDGTIISWKLAFRTGTIELNTTDTTIIVLGHVPTPGGDSVVRENLDLHGSGGSLVYDGNLKRKVYTQSQGRWSKCGVVCFHATDEARTLDVGDKDKTQLIAT